MKEIKVLRRPQEMTHTTLLATLQIASNLLRKESQILSNANKEQSSLADLNRAIAHISVYSPQEVELTITEMEDKYLSDLDYDTLLAFLHTLRSAIKDKDNTMIFDSRAVDWPDTED